MLDNPLKKLKHNETASALLGVVIVIVVAAMTSITILISSSGEGKLVQQGLENTQAFYAAETALNGISFQLKTCGLWNSTICSNITIPTLPSGTAQLDSCIYSDTGKFVDLTLTATYQGKQRQVLATIAYAGCGGNTTLPAAASFKAASPKVNGNLQVDGRNHPRNDPTCTTILPTSGTYAMALEEVASDFNFTGSVDLAATSGGVDYDLSHTIDDRVIFGVADLPETPDEVFDLVEGDLMAMAQSQGHYYDYTGGEDNSAFTVYSGVNYIEMACGDTWQPSSIAMDNAASNAILIIHAPADADLITPGIQPCATSTYKAVGGGDFKGILIVDNIDKLHGNVHGAVVGLGSSVSGINLGNGSGRVCYSTETLEDAVQESNLSEPTLTMSDWQENELDW